ncbi:hypothetical protein ACFUT3_31720 [Streptomyces cinereoruber]|uniref:hypothetical protein n=1 Tax=Streptomyces cinereoruber TaxID=67260 RepID=UPI00363811BC
MSTPISGFAAPRDAADAIVDEILLRRLLIAEGTRCQESYPRVRQNSQWLKGEELILRVETGVEERALLLALGHLLDAEDDPEAYVLESVRRRHLTATVAGAATGEVVLSREGLALRPS